MSKLSQPLKALIAAASAHPNTLPAPAHISSVYERLRNEAASRSVGTSSWLTISVRITAAFLDEEGWLISQRADGDNHDNELPRCPRSAVPPLNLYT
jgi:hypothetical protein